MKINQKLNISASKLYNKIIESVLYDIATHTGDIVKINELKGYIYNKTFGSNTKGKISITDIKENELYAFTTETLKNKYTVKYSITSIDDNTCEIFYDEIMNSYGLMQGLNDKVVGIFLGHSRKKNMKKMISAMDKLS